MLVALVALATALLALLLTARAEQAIQHITAILGSMQECEKTSQGTTKGVLETLESLIERVGELEQARTDPGQEGSDG